MINLLLFLISFGLFLVPINSFAEETPLNKKLGGFKIRVLKRKEEHKHTAALICALLENNSSQRLIDDAWESQLEKPVSSDDEFLVRFIMRDMCPTLSKYYFQNY